MARGKWTKSHQNVMDDFINYMTETLVPEDDEAYWSELIDKGMELSKKYDGSQFVIDLILAHQNACERLYKKGK